MKKEKAQMAADILAEIKLIGNKIEHFNNTKEFCKINISGEDGAEREYSFQLTYKQNKKEVQLIRENIHEMLKERLNQLNKELQEL